MANDDNKASKAERDAAAKAVTDNMARLKALRLAREAASPPAPVKKKAATGTTKSAGKKPAEKSPALAAWLASQQSGGRRT